MTDLTRITSGTDGFRANPAPSVLLSQEVDDEIELKNQRKSQLRRQRAREMLAASSLPESMQMESSLTAAKMRNNKVTIPKPFNLRTESLNSETRHKCHADEVKKRHTALRRSRSWSTLPNEIIKTNTAATLRLEAVKARIRRFEKYHHEIVTTMEKRENLEKEISGKIQEKLRRMEAENLRQDAERRRKLRESELNRRIEYKEQIAEIEGKLGIRPTVLERQEMLIRRQSAESRYQRALRSAGVKQMKHSNRFCSHPLVEPEEMDENRSVKSTAAEEPQIEPDNDSSSVSSSVGSSTASPKSKVSKSSSTVSSAHSSKTYASAKKVEIRKESEHEAEKSKQSSSSSQEKKSIASLENLSPKSSSSKIEDNIESREKVDKEFNNSVSSNNNNQSSNKNENEAEEFFV